MGQPPSLQRPHLQVPQVRKLASWGLIYFYDFFMGAYSKRAYLSGAFLVVGHIPVEIFLLVNYFFDATHTSNRIFFKGQANFF